MKILIHILFFLSTISLFAQSSLVSNHYFEKKQANANIEAPASIMFQNTKPPQSAQNWRKGSMEKRKRIINKNIFKGVLVGAIAGGLVMAPLQLLKNTFNSIFSVKESRDFKLIGAGALIGGAFGAYKGSVIGKRQTEYLKYQEFMKNAKKEHFNRKDK